MIMRIFRARVHPGQGEAFEEFLTSEAIPMTRVQPGAVDFWAGGPFGSNSDEYVFVSLWQDVAALRALRGEDFEEPGIEPHEAGVIKEAFVHHYEAWPTTDGDQ